MKRRNAQLTVKFADLVARKIIIPALAAQKIKMTKNSTIKLSNQRTLTSLKLKQKPTTTTK
jgi:hypothetical protein